MVHRLHRNAGGFLQSPNGGSIAAGTVRSTTDIDDTGAGQNPGIGTVEGHTAGVAPAADAGLTQIIPAGPHKITQQIGILLHHFPVFIDILREGLGTEDDSLRMLLFFQWVAAGAVVIACDIQRIDDRRCQSIHLGRIAALVHAGADEGCHDIEGQTAICDFFLLGLIHRTGLLLTVLIDTLSLGCPAHDHQVQTAGNRAGSIQRMDKRDLLFAVFNTFRFCRLGNFIADGVHNNRGMVIVPVHHGGSIDGPAFLKIQAVVIPCLAIVPHIEGLVHHIHAVIVASFQHSPGSWIVGCAQCIESSFLHNANSTPFTFIVSCGTQNAVVMVDTAAPQQGFFAVDEQSLIAPANRADTKFLFHHIFPAGDLCGVEIGRFIAPQLCIRYGDLANRAAAGCDHLVAIQNFNAYLRGSLGFHLDDSGVDGQGCDFHALIVNMFFFSDVQPHGAVDAGAGVPAGVGQLAVIRNNCQGILSAIVQPGQLHRKGGIAVLMAANDLTVQGNGAVLIYALEFHKNFLTLPRSRSGKSFFVSIYATGEIAVAAVRCVSTALFQNLRIVGQGYRLTVTGPIQIKTDFFHN